MRRVKRFLRALYGKRYRLRTKNIEAVVLVPDDQALYSVDQLPYGLVQDTLNIEGWFYVPDPTMRLVVELDGRCIDEFTPDLARADVCLAYPQINRAATPGFKRRIPVQHQWFNRRGASLLRVSVRIGDDNKQLASSPVYSAEYFPPVHAEMEHQFFFTVGSSNISLGGFGDFKEKLAPFSIGYCQLGFMVPLLYMRSTQGAQQDWSFDPAFDDSRRQTNEKLVIADSLECILQFAVDKQIPCVIGLNGGIWGDAAGTCPEWDLTDHLEEDERNCQWNQDGQVMPDDYLKHLTGAEHAPELSRSLTLNHYNQTVRAYKKRNLQQAAKAIVAFRQQYPELYIASNLDPDCYQNPFFEGEQWYDFNPVTLRQFRDWLAGTGAYAAELKNTLTHQSFTLQALNEHLGTDYVDWQEVEPPREQPCKQLGKKSGPLMQLWEQFRRHLVQRHYSDLTDWLIEAGLSSREVFSSQGFTAPRFTSEPFALRLDSPLKNYDSGGMSLQGSKPDKGHIGAILYGESARNAIRTENGRSFFQNIRELDPDWAVVEFNPADLRDDAKHLPDYAFAWDCLREIFNHGARYLNLMAWNGNTAKDIEQDYFNAHMALRDTPLEAAVIDFMLIHSDVPRGSVCYSFGSNKYASVDGWKSPDSTLRADTSGLVLALDSGAALTLVAPSPYLLDGMQRMELLVKAEQLAGLTVEVWEAQQPVMTKLSQSTEMDTERLLLEFSQPLGVNISHFSLVVRTEVAQMITIERLLLT